MSSKTTLEEPQQPLSPKCLFKHKSNLIKKFFNEPVDALDLRLAKAEENFSSLPQDPLTDIKQEDEEEQIRSKCEDTPLNCSIVQIGDPKPQAPNRDPCGYHKDSRELGQDEEDVQRVTLRAGHFLYGDNINQTPWSSQEEAGRLPVRRPAVLREVGSIKRSYHNVVEPPIKRLRIEKDLNDDIDNRISLAESSERSAWANPLFSEPGERSRPSVLSSPGLWRPSLGYRQRYQELVSSPDPPDCPRLSSSRLDPPPPEATFHQLPFSCIRRELPHLQKKGKLKVQTEDFIPRHQSVIVRNTFRRTKPVASHVSELDQHLEKLQNLRSGFAYNVIQKPAHDLQLGSENLSRDSRRGESLARPRPSETVTSQSWTDTQSHSPSPPPPPPPPPPEPPNQPSEASPSSPLSKNSPIKGKRGRPRIHAPKLPLPPLYVFIRNLLHNPGYNPDVVSWVDISNGCFKVSDTAEFARTWGRMKSNRSEEMNYEKMSRAMRYHYGCASKGRKGHLAMVKEKRLYYKFGELARNWRVEEMRDLSLVGCTLHKLCKNFMCLWTKE